MKALWWGVTCLILPETLKAEGLAAHYPALMALPIWGWMLLTLAFHIGVALFLDLSARRFFPHLKILGDKRRLPRISKWKVGSLFALNSMQTGLIIGLSLDLQSRGWGGLYAIESFSFAQVAIIGLQVLLILFVFDTQYYWMHRWFHSHPKLYRWFHSGHHEARHPTVWHLQYQELGEMFLATTLPMLAIAILPIPISLPAYLTAITMGAFINVGGHLGYEISHTPLAAATPHGWVAYFDKRRRNLARFFNNVLHHDLHHQRFRVNYSLYFTFWDRLAGTMDPDTDRTDKFIQSREAFRYSHQNSAKAPAARY